MIRFDAQEVGSYTLVEINKEGTQEYHISMRSGNCDSVHIWVDAHDCATLVNFIADKEHLKNMEKEGHDPFKNCKDIELNMFHKPNYNALKTAMRFGHEVKCYYKKLW